jgi:hypothetical protein
VLGCDVDGHVLQRPMPPAAGATAGSCTTAARFGGQSTPSVIASEMLEDPQDETNCLVGLTSASLNHDIVGSLSLGSLVRLASASLNQDSGAGKGGLWKEKRWWTPRMGMAVWSDL